MKQLSVRYFRGGKINGTVFRIYNINNCMRFSSVDNETLYI